MELTIVWTGDGKVTYDGNEHTVKAKIVDQDGNEVTEFYYTPRNTFQEKGTHKVTVSFTIESSNYKIVSGSLSTTLTIE